MGGVAGHMYHLYDNPELSFEEIEDIFVKASAGSLIGTEKTDGQNLFLSYSDRTDQAKAARNMGNIKAGGMTADELASKFAGRGDLEKSFTDAFAAFEDAVASLDIVFDQSTTPGTSVDQAATEVHPPTTGIQRESLTPPVEDTTPAPSEPDQEWDLYQQGLRAIETRFQDVLPMPVFERFKGSDAFDPGKVIPPSPLLPADEYVIKQGDTYEGIAQKKYGKGSLWLSRAPPKLVRPDL